MRVKIDLKARAKGDPIEVPYLGVFPNGEETEVSDEQAVTYEAITGEAPPSTLTISDEPQSETDTMTRDQLLELAAGRGIQVPANASKAKILEALRGGE
jgi:hypothetical protein